MVTAIEGSMTRSAKKYRVMMGLTVSLMAKEVISTAQTKYKSSATQSQSCKRFHKTGRTEASSAFLLQSSLCPRLILTSHERHGKNRKNGLLMLKCTSDKRQRNEKGGRQQNKRGGGGRWQPA